MCRVQMNSTSTASKESFSVLLFHMTQSQPNPFQHLSAQCLNLWHCLSLLQIVVCQFARDRMEKWIREDEEASVNRGTSKPGTWCFVFSKF